MPIIVAAGKGTIPHQKEVSAKQRPQTTLRQSENNKTISELVFVRLEDLVIFALLAVELLGDGGEGVA
jgi:hypothetical protein